jgi:hypothetical protein
MRFANDDIFVGGVDRAMLVAHNYVADANRAGFALGDSMGSVKQRVASELRSTGKRALQAVVGGKPTPEGTQLPVPVQSAVKPMSAYLLPVGLGLAAIVAIYFLTQRKGR